MWMLIVSDKDQEKRREQVCESKAAAEKRRSELMKKGIFATVEFRRETTHEFKSGRKMAQQSPAAGSDGHASRPGRQISQVVMVARAPDEPTRLRTTTFGTLSAELRRLVLAPTANRLPARAG